VHLVGFIIRTHKWIASRAWWLSPRVKLSGQYRVLFHASYENEWKIVYVQVGTEIDLQLQRLVNLFKILLGVRVGISGTSVSNGQLPIAWMTDSWIWCLAEARSTYVGEPKHLEQITIPMTVQGRNLGLDLTLRKLNLWKYGYQPLPDNSLHCGSNEILNNSYTLLRRGTFSSLCVIQPTMRSRWKFKICAYIMIILFTVFLYISFCDLKMGHSGRNMSSSA